MITLKINAGARLTIQHPASNFGVPVLVVHDIPYGPEDDLGGHMAGSAIVCSDIITRRPLDGTTAAACEIICRWLSQSAEHGPRWIETVKHSMQQ
jgi:hypothetical protein